MTYETNYISHHGVKGQKWGVRRYQNKNGSLTPAGKRRYGKRHKSNDNRDDDNIFIPEKDYYKTATNFDAMKYNQSKLASESYKTAARIARNVGDKKLNKKIQKRKIRNMSDKDLANAINRLDLESKYASALSKSIDNGKIRTYDVLNAMGDVATISSNMRAMSYYRNKYLSGQTMNLFNKD